MDIPYRTGKEVPVLFNFPSEHSSRFRESDSEQVERVVSFLQENGANVHFVGRVLNKVPDFNYSNGVITFKEEAPSYKEIHLAAIHSTCKTIADKINDLMDEEGYPTKTATKEMGNSFIQACPTKRKRINDWSLPHYSFRFSWKLVDNSSEETPKDIVLGIYESFKRD